KTSYPDTARIRERIVTTKPIEEYFRLLRLFQEDWFRAYPLYHYNVMNALFVNLMHALQENTSIMNAKIARDADLLASALEYLYDSSRTKEQFFYYGISIVRELTQIGSQLKLSKT